MTTAPETGDDMAEFFDQWPEVGDEFPADPPADPDAGYAEVCDYGRPMYCACGRRMYSTGCDAPGCPGARCGHCDIGCDIDLNENGRCTTAIAEEGS